MLSQPTQKHNERMAKITFSSLYPCYLLKIEKKGRTKEELNQVIQWLTGFSESKLQNLISSDITLDGFFQLAKLNPKASLIKGVICGYKIEDIENVLTRKARYMDKLVDELAKGKPMSEILRK